MANLHHHTKAKVEKASNTLTIGVTAQTLLTLTAKRDGLTLRTTKKSPTLTATVALICPYSDYTGAWLGKGVWLGDSIW